MAEYNEIIDRISHLHSSSSSSSSSYPITFPHELPLQYSIHSLNFLYDVKLVIFVKKEDSQTKTNLRVKVQGYPFYRLVPTELQI